MTLALGALAAGAFAFIVSTHAADPAIVPEGDGVGYSQYRRLVDPSPRSATGTIVLRKKGNVQTVETSLKGLQQDSLAIYFALEPIPPDQPQEIPDYIMYNVCPFPRINAPKGNWFAHLEGLGEAPPLIPFISDLDQAAGHGFVLGSVADSALITGVTNIFNGVTNIVFGIPLPLPDVTNIVTAPFWAPLPVISANPASLSYHRKTKLTPPAVNPPAPHAKGILQYSFDGTSGRSVFEVNVTGMPGGQTPHIYISNDTDPSTNLLIDAGTMTMNTTGRTGRYIRDTQFGDPLPQQAANAGDLSGRFIYVMDLNGNPPFIYVQGVIP
jgi:hypothetical protein